MLQAAHKVQELFRLLRASALSGAEAFTGGIALLAWAKLSVRGQLSPRGSIQRAICSDVTDIQGAVLHASAERADGLLADLGKLKDIDPGPLLALLTVAHGLAVAGELDGLSLDALLPRGADGPFPIPNGLVSLMVKLGEVSPGESIYVPWDFYAQVAIAVHRQGAQASIESPIRSSILKLLLLLADASVVSVNCSDPIIEPSLLDDGTLRKFDVALCVPPIGARYERHVSRGDRWGRFQEHTTSGTVLALRQVLVQTKRRAVVVVPHSFLSNTGPELALRQDLLSKGLIEAVISFPKGLLGATTAATALLVLDPRGGHERLRLFDAGASVFCHSRSRTTCQITDPDGIVEAVRSSTSASVSGCITVLRTAVLSNDANLQVSRYITAPVTVNLSGKCSTQGLVKLGELVDTIRPLHPTIRRDVPASAHSVGLYEVGAVDLPEYGYVTSAQRCIAIDRATIPPAGRPFIKPLDIILIVKGSVGKVGIASGRASSGGWLVGQSGIVLRVREPSVLDPRVLFLLLRSPVGQQMLQGIVAGSTTPLIQLRELLDLRLPIPSPDEGVSIAQALEAEHRIQCEIENLRIAQAQVAAHLWPVEHAGHGGDTDDQTSA